jgi:hypothetical protein
MATLKIEIDLENAAFEGDCRDLEISRILIALAQNLADCGILRDINGNSCGAYTISK